MQNKSMDWFLYDNGLRQERVKRLPEMTLSPKKKKILKAVNGHLLWKITLQRSLYIKLVLNYHSINIVFHLKNKLHPF